MNIAITSSTKDTASANIKENLVNSFKFNKINKEFDNNGVYEFITNNTNNKNIKLYTVNSELIFTDNLDKIIDADMFVFISKHRAQEDRASLTCHAIGNFGKAEHGGKENTLCPSNPALLKNIFNELNKNAQNSGYEATMEATHHGPYMEKPVCFVELGSNEKYWEDKYGGLLVAKSVIRALEKFNGFAAMDNNPLNEKNNDKNHNKINIRDNNINNTNNNHKNYSINNNYINKASMEKSDNGKNINNRLIKNKNLIEKNNNYESVFVVGGSHYNHVANKAMLQSNLAVGHICAKYDLENLNENLLRQAMGKCSAKFVLLDWKGLGKEKIRIIGLLDGNNIEYKRSDKVF